MMPRSFRTPVPPGVVTVDDAEYVVPASVAVTVKAPAVVRVYVAVTLVAVRDFCVHPDAHVTDPAASEKKSPDGTPEPGVPSGDHTRDISAAVPDNVAVATSFTRYDARSRVRVIAIAQLPVGAGFNRKSLFWDKKMAALSW